IQGMIENHRSVNVASPSVYFVSWMVFLIKWNQVKLEQSVLSPSTLIRLVQEYFEPEDQANHLNERLCANALMVIAMFAQFLFSPQQVEDLFRNQVWADAMILRFHSQKLR